MALRQGPCAAPGCPNPESSRGQWTWIPQGFEGELAEGNNGCLCKRDGCRAHLIWAAAAEYDREEAGSGRGLRRGRRYCRPEPASAVPPPPHRPGLGEQVHAAPPCAPPCILSCLLTNGARRASRNANLAEMSEAERENKIITASETLEYLVHGHWEPTQGHINGRYCAWWVNIYYILKSGLKEQDLKKKLDLFEEGQRAVRNEAIAEAKARLAAEGEDEDD